MKLKKIKELEIISISNRDVEVVKSTNFSVTFRAFVGVDMAAAIENKVTICNFRLKSGSFLGVNRPVLSSLNSNSALRLNTAKKLGIVKSASNITVQGTIDVTRQIPNDKITKISSGAPVKISKLVSLVDIGEDGSRQLTNENQAPAPDSGAMDFMVSYSIDTLMRSKRDPASEYNSIPFHAPVGKITRGVRSSGEISRLSEKSKKFLNSSVDTSAKPISSKLIDVEDKIVDVPFTFTVIKNSLGRYEIEIDAIAKILPHIMPDGARLQTIKFEVDLKLAYDDFIIPTKAPILNVASVGSSRFLRIKQVDKNATSVRIYRRVFREKLIDSDTDFEQIAEIPARFNDSVQFVDRPNKAGKCVYRAVPFNEKMVSSGEFSSVVVPGMRLIEKKSAPDTTTLFAMETNGQIVVSAYNVPNDVICLRIARKNLSIHEKDFTTPDTIIGSSIVRVTRSEKNISFNDRAARPDTVYEYKVFTTDVRGDEKISQRSCVIRFCGDERLQSNRSIVSQSPKTTLEQEPKVTFQIDAPADPSTLDKIYDILISNGISEQYSNEIRQNRELFSKIIAFEITRFDTVTGLNESFGIVKSGVFEDSSRTRKSSNVSVPVSGRNYIYGYRLLLRSPSTLFDTAEVGRVDIETAKQFTTKLRKFNSPNVLAKGVLVSQVEQIRPVSKIGLGNDPTVRGDNDLIAGRTALMGSTEIKIPNFNTKIQKFVARETSRGNVLRWNIMQGSQEIDHVIIYADYNRKKAPLRALQYCGANDMVYLDDRLVESLNNVRYYIKLVFTDFRQSELFGPAEIK
jgi:hypothetical protein